MNSTFNKLRGGAVEKWNPRVGKWETIPAPKKERKTRAKAPQVQQRMYHGAKASRLTPGFGGWNTSADSELNTSLTRLRTRSRQLVRDNPYARRARSLFIANTVGFGVSFDAKVGDGRGLNARINDQIEGTWEQWSYAKSCHTGGELCFSDIERVGMAELFEAGEVLVRVRPMKFGGISDVPLCVELIEAERLADEFTQPGVPAPGNLIRMGVESDRYYRPQAYWIRISHPGDVQMGLVDTATRYERVPADEIFHLRLITRWPQSRGEPPLCAVMRKLNDMDGYSEAEIVAARVSANVVFAKKPGEGADPYDPMGEQQPDGADEFAVEPGMGIKLQPGEEMTMMNPARPNTAFDYFMRAMLREVAAGLDLPYDMLSQDYSQTNMSSSRLATIEARDAWRAIQQWWIRAFREPLHRIFVRQAVLSRQIPAISAESYLLNPLRFEAVRWQTKGWDWIDPQKDVEAARLAEAAGYLTKTQVLAQKGTDIEDYVAERKREIEMFREAGIHTDTDPGDESQMELPLEPKPKAGGGGGAAPPDEQDDEDTTRRARVVSFRG